MGPWAHIVEHLGHIYYCGCVNDQYLSPYQWGILIIVDVRMINTYHNRLLRKSRPLIFGNSPPRPTSFNIWAYLPSGCVDDQYLSPYQTKAKWLLWLLKKSRSFIFQNMPLGPTFFNIWDISVIADVRMINTYHHTKPEPSDYFCC